MYCKKCGKACLEKVDGGIQRFICQDDKCGYIDYRNPYPCVSVLITEGEKKIILGKRKAGNMNSNRWCLPCGYIEYGETYIEAAKREVREETGLEIELKGIINVVSNQFENGINSLVVVLLAQNITDTLIPG